MTLALKMFQATFSLNFPASLVAPTRAGQIKPGLWSAHCECTLGDLVMCIWEREGEREREQKLKNRVLFPPSCPLRDKSLRKLFFVLFWSALPPPPALSISTSFHKPPTESPGLKRKSSSSHSHTHAFNKDKVTRSESQTSFKQTWKR